MEWRSRIKSLAGLWEKVLHRKREEAISKGIRSRFGMADSELGLHTGRYEQLLFNLTDSHCWGGRHMKPGTRSTSAQVTGEVFHADAFPTYRALG